MTKEEAFETVAEIAVWAANKMLVVSLDPSVPLRVRESLNTYGLKVIDDIEKCLEALETSEKEENEE